MFTREMTAPPQKMISGGKPVFGAFEGNPGRLDIRGVKNPFGKFPLPSLITNFRIKSSLMFLFDIGSYIGTVDFFDHKIFGYSEVVFWNKETGRKFSYCTFMGPRRRFIPHNMVSGFTTSFGKSRYIRVSWDKKRDRISLIFNLKGDSSRPSARAAFLGHYSDTQMCEVSEVLPAPSRLRCSASYHATPKIHGSITLGHTKNTEEITMPDTDGHGIFYVNRSYYNYHSYSEFISGTGEYNGKNFAFQIFTTQENAVDSENINGNILCVDGKCTPLPPVTITHPYGLTKKWVIQDFENMVDLTFTPISDNLRDTTFLVMRSHHHTLYGTIEGVIKTKDGEDIVLHDFKGISKNQMLRL